MKKLVSLICVLSRIAATVKSTAPSYAEPKTYQTDQPQLQPAVTVPSQQQYGTTVPQPSYYPVSSKLKLAREVFPVCCVGQL